jgi:phospholipid/cholesterol/gamma-HCH transport system substrate-binding protein
MARINTEVVGFFLLLAWLGLGYLAVTLGKMEVVGTSSYTVQATFPNVAGLRVGSPVEIAGVEAGWVERIRLKNDQAVVDLRINDAIQLREDSIASIRTKGLIGEPFVRVAPGGAEKNIPPGGEITETEPPVDIMELIANYAFGKI